ncbi:proline-rich domain-containing protein [Actinosynnema sp. NPDC047251]|uniref:Putative membrane protein n=1 Tax=Saccharothrix espanaensis (strain ATCC 51144 / DSM 44229 / JCM 9112 / NBRC 15066 / NRRL 15764) TaxID=1179773 RepID=K0KCM3_SACES|nr:proline-rich domain-containing protein [Saccharothrix espanaensis]CCH35297.1 putative membrane protein [Saccharothrix espanaensis DSM 44229]
MTTPQDPYGQQGGYPQQPGGHPQQGGYPQQPGYPPQAPPLSPGELSRPPRPKSVDTAFLLWMVGAGIGILSSIISFITAQALYDELTKGLDPSLRGSLGGGPAYGTAIFSIILFAVWVLIVFQMRNGANWARIVLAVLGGIGVISGLVGLAGFGLLFSIGFFGVIQALLSLVSLAVTVGALIFMFKPDANHYFKSA